MLSKLSQIITSVPGNGSSSEQELERSPANSRREQARLRQRSQEGSYTALHSASDDDSIISSRRPPLTPSRSGPSNVSWISNNIDPKLTHAASAPLIGRSASASSVQQAQGRAITNLQAKSTHSLRLDYRRTSPIATANPFALHQTQSLTPIREQFSPEHRPAGLPPVNPLREVDVTDDIGARNSPAASYHSSSFFISRPLKRSISQGSANTFASSAPSIPPVDLRPPFAIPPYTSNRTGPLPTIEGSLRKGSEEDADGSSLRTASFVTAPTVYTYAGTSTPSLASQVNKDPHDHDGEEGEDGDIGAVRDSRDLRASVISSDRERRLYHLSLAVNASRTPSLSSEHLRPPSPEHHNHASFIIEPRSRTPSLNSGLLRPPSIAASGNSVTEERSQRTSSFIDRRWLKGQSFSEEDIHKLKTLVPGSIKERESRVPKIMFCLGFVLGPWCWLIGGWLLDSYGDVGLRGTSKATDVEAQNVSGANPADKGKGKSRQGDIEHRYLPIWLGKAKSGGHNWDTLRIYPIFAPSTEMLATEKSQTGSRERGIPYFPGFVKLKNKAGELGANTNMWVYRCRAAAVVSGILLILAFLAALLVVAGLR